ncbi:hypothetical protein EV122DRAFT_285213 [Schizophyllum commune]
MPSPPFSLSGLVLWPFDSLIPFCRRLYLLPRLVNIFIRRFHVTTSSKSRPPLSLKQRIFVCRAAISSLQMRCPLRPSPHIGPPLIPTSPPTPLGVEAIYRRPPSEILRPRPPLLTAQPFS